MAQLHGEIRLVVGETDLPTAALGPGAFDVIVHPTADPDLEIYLPIAGAHRWLDQLLAQVLDVLEQAGAQPVSPPTFH